jgi:hypothetical protein
MTLHIIPSCKKVRVKKTGFPGKLLSEYVLLDDLPAVTMKIMNFSD